MRNVFLLVVAGVAGLAAAGGAFAQAGIQRVQPQAQAQPAQPSVAPMAAPAIGAAPPSPAAQQKAQRPAMPTPMAGEPLDLVKESINSVAPLSVEEIKRLRTELKKRANAATEPLSPVAKPSTRVATLDLSPGSTPEVIRISLSEGAVVSFIDAAGRPWPIEHADNFNPVGFDIATFGKNSISIASKMEQAVGNVAVRLEGMSSALSFKVLSGNEAARELDYAVDLQVPRYLPGAPVPIGSVSTQPALGVDELMDYLLRTPPRDAKQLKVDGLPGAMAWQTPTGRIMIRTDATVVSPNAKRRQSGSDRMTVFDIPPTPYVTVMNSDDGRFVNVRISGFSISQEARK